MSIASYAGFGPWESGSCTRQRAGCRMAAYLAFGDDAAWEPRDLPLTPSDIRALLRVIAQLFNTEERATVLLQSVMFPRELVDLA